MPRLTVTFDEDLYEWIEREADARDRSKAWVVTQAVEDARAGDEQITRDHRTDDHQSDDRITDLVTAIEDLGERVAELEATQGTPGHQDERAAPRERPASGEGTGSANGGDATATDTAASDEAGVAAADVETDVEAAAREVVDRVAREWNDDPDRLEARKAAATVALVTAATDEEPIGKSDDVVEEIREAHPVEGQSRETYWRKNLRPVLSEVGSYSQGHHGYRVDPSDLL